MPGHRNSGLQGIHTSPALPNNAKLFSRMIVPIYMSTGGVRGLPLHIFQKSFFSKSYAFVTASLLIPSVPIILKKI